jgi:tetratricopeptide (TPR) repeat protein
VTDAPTGPGVAAEDRWHLEDRRDFLRRSLADADREHDAGDLSDDDYVVLRRRDERLLADVEASLTALGDDRSSPSPSPSPSPASESPMTRSPWPGLVPLVVDEDDEPRPRRHRRTWLAVVGTLAIVAGVVLLVVHLTSPRLPGETATGSITLSHSQQIQEQLAEATTLVQKNELVAALGVYKQVLSETPHQPQALAEWGWLEWQAAQTAGNLTLAAEGRSAVAESVKVDPSLYAGYLYLGTILLAQKQPAAAVAEYQKFLANHPPKAWITNAAPSIAKAFSEAHQPLPAGVKPAG